MAGAGYKLFATGDVLSASDVNTYMMQQTVMVFANASARTTALSTVLSEGMVSYLQDTNSLEVYDGSAWVGATGDITGLTAGTGVSITSATGPVPTVAIDTAVVPRLGVANTFTVGPQTLEAGASANIPLIVKGAVGQSTDLMQFQDSTGTVLAKMSRIPRFVVGTDTNATLSATNAAATTVGLVVRGAASQTASLQEWQTSAGTATTVINSGGRIYSNQRMSIGFPVATPVVTAHSNFSNDTDAARIVALFRGASGQSANITEWQDSGGNVLSSISSAGVLTLFANDGANAHRTIFTANTSGVILNTTRSAGTASTFVIQTDGSERFSVQAGAPARFTGTAAAAVGLIVRGAASQTANLFEAQNDSATVVSNITATGRFGISIISNVANTGTYMDTGANTIRFEQRAAATVGIIVKGAVSQTGNLQEWQTSGGVAQSYVDSAGNINFSSTGSFAQASNGRAYFRVNSATAVPLTLRAAASQTANLTEWQDSTGTVLAAITASGQIAASSLNTFNFHINATENSSGGRIRFKKLTAASGNPGADYAQLYFRDGTNAGTLKLVVRAGASGAETTILDNIPQ